MISSMVQIIKENASDMHIVALYIYMERASSNKGREYVVLQYYMDRPTCNTA